MTRTHQSDPLADLSRRERQIVEILLKEGSANVADVRARLLHAPSYDAVRTTLRILEQKGVVRHHEEGRRYVYSMRVRETTARDAALRRLVRTFFGGSFERAALALLQRSELTLDEDEVRRIEQRIKELES